MKALFRADATPALGAGHVARCLALASELAARGTEVIFVVGNGSDLAASMVAARGFPSRTLGANAASDAEETAHIASTEGVNWVVVDHYSLDAAWEGKVRRAGVRIAVIEDLPGRRHDCDLLVDSAFGAEASPSAPARALLGPQYAMLAAEFRHSRGRARDGSVRRVLVSYGGTDPTNETCKALAALAAVGGNRPDIEVAVGNAFPHADALQAAMRNVPGARLHRGLPHLADLMRSCDLALGAGGTSTWERLCVGVPAIVTTTAANQLRSTVALAADGYFLYLGPAEQVTSEAMTRSLTSRMADPDALRRESARGQALVDGAGTARIAEALLGA
jgi:UDP-2,4-diacetamido-2,4,6-trideoxy-beta-L-altropyranose hydrolase